MRISDWSSDVCSSDLVHIVGEGSCVALRTFELRYPAEMTFADAAPGRIGEIGILDRVNIFDLVEDRIVRDQILDRRSAKVVRVEVAVKFVELEGGDRKSTRLNSSH